VSGFAQSVAQNSAAITSLRRFFNHRQVGAPLASMKHMPTYFRRMWMWKTLGSRLHANGRRLAALSSLLILMAGSPPAPAHHAFAAEYDGDKPFDLSGTVTKARWVNPHSWLYFDVKGADGTVTNWGVELAAPNALASKGLEKADLAAGAVIHVKGFLTKNGGPFGYAVTLTLADGRSFQTGGAPNTPASDAAKSAPASY
jgi:hypothetical protein